MVNKYLQVLKRSAPAFISLFSSTYTMVQVFPYLPWMVQHLMPELQEKDIGYYSGIIASFQFIGRTTGSFIWGWLTDKYGRRKVLILSGILLSFATFGFGVSNTVFVAILFRFLIGFLNGIVPTSKACISEYSDDSTQAFAMGLLGSVFSLGLVFGSAFSGLSADPVTQYNIHPYKILVRFPYVLPGVANATILIFGVCVVYFFMEEPVKKLSIVTRANFELENVCSSDGENYTGRRLNSPPVVDTGKCHRFVAIIRKSIFYNLMTDWTVMLTIVVYSIFSMVTISMDEVLPLWVKTPRDLGGLAISIKRFSLIISISAVVSLPITIFSFQLLEKYFGGLKAYKISVLLLIPVCVLMPIVSAFNDTSADVLLGLFNMIMRLLFSSVFAALSMFTNNSVTPDKLGSVNGLSLSLCSIFRAIAPIYGGTVFAGSLNSNTFPFDFHLIFVLNGIVLVFCIVLGQLMPESLNRKKILKSRTMLTE